MPRSNHGKRDQRCHQEGHRNQGRHRQGGHHNQGGHQEGNRNQGGHRKIDDHDDRRRKFWRYDDSSSSEESNQRDRHRHQGRRDQGRNNVGNYLSPPETPDNIPKGEIFHGQLLGMNNQSVDQAVNNEAVVPRNSSIVNGATGTIAPSSRVSPISILDDLHGQVAADYVDRFDGRRLHPDETRGCVGRPCCFDCQDICTRPFTRPCILDGYCDPCSGALINKYDTFPFKYRLCPPRRCC